jgi:hypothetical protein
MAMPFPMIDKELNMTWMKGAMLVIAALVLTLLCASGSAQADLIINGGFESTANIPPITTGPLAGAPSVPGVGGIGQIDYNTTVTGWSNPDISFPNTGYDFIWNPATASTTGSNGYHGGIALWGPGNGFNNGLTASPAGGQFLGADGDSQFNGRIVQTVNGLIPGRTYQLGFWWAGAQQAGAGGIPNEWWIVSLGSETHETPHVSLGSPGGFTGWMFQTLSFTATAPTENLTFLASEGGPFGGPPFLLLDGVTLGVPEPSSILLVSAGLFGLGVVRRLRQRRAAPAAA